MNESDPSGLLCADALDPFSSGFGQCWSSGYSNAVHHPAETVALAGAVAAVTLVTIGTAGGDLPVLGTIGGGTVIEAGAEGTADTIFVTGGTQITAATAAGGISVVGSAAQTIIDCSHSWNATCAYDAVTTAIGTLTATPGLAGSDLLKSLIGLLSTLPSPFDSTSDSNNVCKP